MTLERRQVLAHAQWGASVFSQSRDSFLAGAEKCSLKAGQAGIETSHEKARTPVCACCHYHQRRHALSRTKKMMQMNVGGYYLPQKLWRQIRWGATYSFHRDLVYLSNL